MLLRLFLWNGSDRHAGAAADSGSDVLEPHTLFGNGVIPTSPSARFQGKPVETSDVEHMRRQASGSDHQQHMSWTCGRPITETCTPRRASATAVASDAPGQVGEGGNPGSSSVAARP